LGGLVAVVYFPHKVAEGFVDVFSGLGADSEKLAVVLCLEFVDTFFVFFEFVLQVCGGE
jgi:hypothetical protein